MDPIRSGDFLKLIGKTETAFCQHRHRGELMLWSEPAIRSSTSRNIPRLAIDAVLFKLAAAFVDQGPPWRGIALAAPGLQLTLPNAVDREDTFAAICVASAREFSIGCGTIGELLKQGVVGRAMCPIWMVPIDSVIADLRARAARHKIALPAAMAPPPVAAPLWARSDPAWVTRTGGIRLEWSPGGHVEATSLALAN